MFKKKAPQRRLVSNGQSSFATRFSISSTETVVALLRAGHCALRLLPRVTDSLLDVPVDQLRKMEIHDGTSELTMGCLSTEAKSFDLVGTHTPLFQ
jgi:hypothetical protein